MCQDLERIAVPNVERQLYVDCLGGYKIDRQGYLPYLCSIQRRDQYIDYLEHLLDWKIQSPARCPLITPKGKGHHFKPLACFCNRHSDIAIPLSA